MLPYFIALKKSKKLKIKNIFKCCHTLSHLKVKKRINNKERNTKQYRPILLGVQPDLSDGAELDELCAQGVLVHVLF